MAQCIDGFIPYNGACVKSCPAGFQFLSEGNQPRCAYKSDNSKSVPLTPVPSIPVEAGRALPTLDQIRSRDPARYTQLMAETDRVNGEIAILMKTVDKKTQIDNAFKTLQRAEDARDEAPEAYQTARTAYYTLTKGPSWVDEETKRIVSAEIDPEINRYRSTYTDAVKRKDAQQHTQDAMVWVKDGVLSLKDDIQYTTKTFQNQISQLKNQINIERRGREHEDTDNPFYAWIDAVLNLLIVVGLLIAGYMIWRKVSQSPSAYAPAVSTM